MCGEMIVDRLISEHREFAGLSVNPFSILGVRGVVSLPIAPRNGTIAVPAVGPFPSRGIDVIPAAEQRSGKGGSFAGRKLDARVTGSPRT